MRKYLDFATKPSRSLIEKAGDRGIRRILEVEDRVGLNGYATVRGSWEIFQDGEWITHSTRVSYQQESTVSARINGGSYQEIPA